MNPLIQAVALAASVAAVTQYTVVDSAGHVVGTLVTDAPISSPMRVVGIAAAARTYRPSPADRAVDRTFRPDDSRALTVEQTSRAWQDEWDRIDPPVVTGGG